MPSDTRFAVTFVSLGSATDLETYHPLAATRADSRPIPKDREFLAAVTLTIWLIADLGLWEAGLRRPVWPLRLGRSQDLASARTRRVELASGAGFQRQAIVPAELTQAGTRLRLPTVIAEDRSRTRRDDYRYAARGADTDPVSFDYVTPDRQALALLPPTHPSRLDPGAAS
jgi:CRISPR-associated protein Cas5t